jgi:deoxyadenosine/deoxycytidine kinase
LVDRHKQLTSDLEKLATNKEWIVADYSVFKSLIFAKITLDEREYKLYHSLFESIYKEFSKPDLYVYLYQNQDRLLANIKKRGRDYEQNISEAYLEKINTGYLEFMQSNTLKNKILIDITDLDFVQNQLDYVTVLEKIKEGITNLSIV